MVDEARKALVKIVKGKAVGYDDLARMIVGGRIGSLRKKLLSAMINREADELLVKYSDQTDLPLENGKQK